MEITENITLVMVILLNIIKQYYHLLMYVQFNNYQSMQGLALEQNSKAHTA